MVMFLQRDMARTFGQHKFIMPFVNVQHLHLNKRYC